MAITFDPAKRDWTLRVRGLDFLDAPQVFAGRKFEFPDERKDYGELRMTTVGFLRARMIVICWTPREENQHVFSMRKANDKEQTRYGPHIR